MSTTRKRTKGEKPAPLAPVPAAQGVERVSLSLHATDRRRLEEIEDYLRSLGHREGNRSLLVKVALRGLQLTPAIVEHLRAAQAEDGRRRAQ
jgi:hypothetical protein